MYHPVHPWIDIGVFEAAPVQVVVVIPYHFGFCATYHPQSNGNSIEAAIAGKHAIAASPNPFNNHTSLKISLPEAGNVSLKLYDVNDIDGVRLNMGDGWGLLRASNTQPVLVMRFEAQTEARLQEIRDLVEGKLRGFLE